MDKIKENLSVIAKRLLIDDEIRLIYDGICEKIEDDFFLYQYKKEADQLYKLTGVMKYDLFGHDVTIDFKVYDFFNKHLLRTEAKKINYEVQFCPTTSKLKITLVSLFNKIVRIFTEDMVCREIEKAYYWYQGEGLNTNFRRLEDAAIDFSRRVFKENNSGTLYNLALVMYYSYPRFQENFLLEYYGWLLDCPLNCILLKTQNDKCFRLYESLYLWLKKNKANDKVKLLLDNFIPFGYSGKNLLSYISMGYLRLKNNMKNIRELVFGLSNERIII